VITEVIMPKAGMDMQEGTIVKWMKKEGEYVEHAAARGPAGIAGAGRRAGMDR
jgi:hypothetical protein